jgi:hypothetical protein
MYLRRRFIPYTDIFSKLKKKTKKKQHTHTHTPTHTPTRTHAHTHTHTHTHTKQHFSNVLSLNVCSRSFMKTENSCVPNVYDVCVTVNIILLWLSAPRAKYIYSMFTCHVSFPSWINAKFWFCLHFINFFWCWFLLSLINVCCHRLLGIRTIG